MVNQRDTSISKLLLLPDPSRSPKIERRNDLFVNIVSTLIVRREREHGRVLQHLKVPAPLKKTRDHKEHVRQWATPPPRNFLSAIYLFLSPRILTCIGGAVQCSFTPSFSLAFVKRTNFSTTEEKDYPEWLFSLSLNPDWRGFPKIFFFFFLSHFITLKLLFSLLMPDLHYIRSGNIRMRKQQKMMPDTTQAIKRCIYEWINQLNAIVQIIRRSIKYLKVSSIHETFLLRCHCSGCQFN